MAQMTKKLVKQIWDSTAVLWRQACAEWYKANNLPQAGDASYIPEEGKEWADRRYRELICQMSTKDLELIIEAYNKDKIRRAKVTIDAILTELLERAAFKSEKPKV